ncbi:hypothetical protein MJN51_37415, partial [Salmonella enterica subsp. enterica serovar Kentucky]|nr:hypothetical protein [Salmonella enterica subsp. enterica serovar Kentucky]
FVDITTVAPDVQVDMRYFTSHNFIGRPIKGYNAPVCLLTRPAGKPTINTTTNVARINQIMRTSVTKQDAHHNGKFITVDVLACQ